MLDAIIVLFVCTGNFYRDRFAEAVFSHAAPKRDPHRRGESRGFSPHLATAGLHRASEVFCARENEPSGTVLPRLEQNVLELVEALETKTSLHLRHRPGPVPLEF